MERIMHFDIELLGNGNNHFYFHGHGHFSMDYDEVILDPSVLFYLTSHEIKETQIVYYLPDNLIRLIEKSKENEELRDFLKSFLSYFGYRSIKHIQKNNWNIFYQNIQRMTIKPISQKDILTDQKENYYDKYLKLFSKHKFYISMSPMINFLGDIIAKIMEFSKKTGTIILSKSRKLADLLREKIMALELPKHFTEILNHFDKGLKIKSELLNKIFDFKGGRSAKFFIGVCLGIGGITHPVIGGISAAFVFIDP
jgi:hypothetical protein